jgi:hypothetical protein
MVNLPPDNRQLPLLIQAHISLNLSDITSKFQLFTRFIIFNIQKKFQTECVSLLMIYPCTILHESVSSGSLLLPSNEKPSTI